jgi:hypothetical protein
MSLSFGFELSLLFVLLQDSAAAAAAAFPLVSGFSVVAVPLVSGLSFCDDDFVVDDVAVSDDL